MEEIKKTLHFMLRYSDKITKVDTILEHADMLSTHGSVWIGKFGVGASKHFINIAKEQISKGYPCYLYLMKGSSLTHKANITEISAASTAHGSGVPCPDKNITPSYYKNKHCSVWFKIESLTKTTNESLNNLWLYNSPALSPSTRGMRGLIYLTDQKKLKPQKKTTREMYNISLFD